MTATQPAPGIGPPSDAGTVGPPDIASHVPIVVAADPEFPEPDVEKWPRKVRLAFIVAATAGLWLAVSRFWA